jgi:Fe-S cluster assembly protein SufD
MVAGYHEDASPLVALNAAFAPDGLLIDVDEGAAVDLPVRLLFVMTTASTPLMQSPRTIIRAGRASRLSVVEHYTGETGSEGFTNTVTQVIAGEDADVTHVRFQDESAKSTQIGNLIIDQAGGSAVAAHSLSFGALLARQDVHVRLNAPRSSVTLNGLYMVAGRQHVDHHTRIDHFHPDCRSEEHYKGILDGHGRGVFNGKVVVHANAVKTDAQQSNRNLLLSKDAEVDTKPELEIYADDVKCAHGATVGQLDANAIFYLRSRGLDADTARGLLTYAFACDIVNRIGIDTLQHDIAARVAGRLPVAADLLEAQ